MFFAKMEVEGNDWGGGKEQLEAEEGRRQHKLVRRHRWKFNTMKRFAL